MQEAKQEREKQNKEIEQKRKKKMGPNTDKVSLRKQKQWSPCLQCKQKKIRKQETGTQLELEEERKRKKKRLSDIFSCFKVLRL